MLTILQRPELVTPPLIEWLNSLIHYDEGGRYSVILKDEISQTQPLLSQVISTLGRTETFCEILMQAYRHGKTSTPCHTDIGRTGLSFILSIGAPRTFRLHRESCESLTDSLYIECINGTVIVMEEDLHTTWHHQVVEDPHIVDERLSLVFRTKPRGK